MKGIFCGLSCVIALFLTIAVSAQEQKTFEGYSLEVEADNSGACPVKYLPPGQNSIDVFVAGSNLQTPATGLKACGGSRVQGSQVTPDGTGEWCFQGSEDYYEVKLKNNVSYLWHPITKDTGFYNVKEFQPIRRTAGTTPKYEFTTPADHTKTIKNALAFLAARQGGTLYFPDGDYVVGTTNGSTRDPNYQAITIPSGVTIVGAGTNISFPTSPAPPNRSATRIRLRNENQTIFRIGGCTRFVAVKNMELLGNTAGPGESPRKFTGNYGIEALGKWTQDPATRALMGNTSHYFNIEFMTFQNLDKAIYVHNATPCLPGTQLCNSWQADHFKVDHGAFYNNNTGIEVHTFNTDWIVSNSFFAYMEANAPGIGIYIQKAGTFLIQQTFGGGYDYAGGIGGTFVHVETVGSLTINSSSSERSRRSIYTVPWGAITSQMLTIMGSIFNDPIELNGRMNFTSVGNFYYGGTMKTAPEVTINSVGDKFCIDPLVMPGHCKDSSGRPTSKPGINQGRIMFKSGRFPEGTGADLIERQPNYFGYDVELGDGLMQFDPDITFKDITAMAAQAPGSPRVKDGAMVYCKDCRKSNTGACTQGQAGSDGAFAKRVNGQWRCD